jgi:hypothetical protein
MVDHGTSWDFKWYSKNGDHPGIFLLISAARGVFFNWGSLGFLKLEINWDITGIYLLAGGAITILKIMEKCLKPQTSILYI